MLSALNQTFKDYEVLVVDDGSTDLSPQIIESFSDPKLRLIKKEHSGCWPTKNFAIENSNGTYLCFLDSDDFLSNDYLEKGMSAIKKFPTYDYYYPTEMKIVKNDLLTDNIWRYVNYTLADRWKLINLFFYKLVGGIPHGGAIIKKEIFSKFGFYDDSLYNYADSDFVIRNALKIKFKMIDNLKSYYRRQHDNNLCVNMQQRVPIVINLLDFCLEEYDCTYFFPELKEFTNLDMRKKQFYEKIVIFITQNSKNIPKFEKEFEKLAIKYLRKLRAL